MLSMEKPNNFKQVVMDIFNNPNDNEESEFWEIESDLIHFDLLDDNNVHCKCCNQKLSIAHLHRHFVSQKHRTAKLYYFVNRNKVIHAKLVDNMNTLHSSMRMVFEQRLKGEINDDEFLHNMTQVNKYARSIKVF